MNVDVEITKINGIFLLSIWGMSLVRRLGGARRVILLGRVTLGTYILYF